jgi:hypothetical protein
MFRFDEDLMAQRLSDRCPNRVASTGGNALPHRAVATENGLRGLVFFYSWISHRNIYVSVKALVSSNPLNL